jgi:hypothetical protein
VDLGDRPERLTRSAPARRFAAAEVGQTRAVPESWTIRHFTLANPIGTDRGDVPALLRRVADHLETLGEIEVQDLIMGTEVTDDGLVHGITVYFNHKRDGADVVSLLR